MEEKHKWAAPLGASIVIAIFLLIGISIADAWSVVAAAVEAVWKVIADCSGTTWAAWVQAIGSVGAIWGAIHLGRRSERAAAAGAKAHLAVYKSNLMSAMRELNGACEYEDRGQMQDGLDMLKDAMGIGNSLRLDSLSPAALSEFSSFRQLAAEAAAVVSRFVISKAAAFGRFDTVEPRIAHIIETMIQIQEHSQGQAREL